MKTTTTRAALIAAAALSLSACTAEPAPPAQEPAPAETSNSAPAPTPTDVPIGDDTVLAIDTIALAPDGAALDVALRVQRSLRADDPAASELRSLMVEACGPDFVTDEVLDSEQWGLVEILVTAQQMSEQAWPSDQPISLITAPRGELAAAAVTGSGDTVGTPGDPAGELGPCLVPQHLTGAGEASVVLGIRHDFTSDDAQGLFWNAYRYGVSSELFGQETAVEFADCQIEKTLLGQELAAPEIGYSVDSTTGGCSAGVPPTQ